MAVVKAIVLEAAQQHVVVLVKAVVEETVNQIARAGVTIVVKAVVDRVQELALMDVQTVV